MNDTKKEIPFFARFLEGQDTLQVKTSIKAGQTKKYPSDSDELQYTQKYPSDGDET
ncbi:MAG TPA: microviridin/marinostatin family tricyclic proteinase inhibitor [Blastocatellia bacterium]|nr:microviridin/marinostatin family tricyclic proteinase inhibitor [Blastocatellia bacterium]